MNIPDGDKSKVVAHVEKYYEKMGMESPFKSEETDMEMKEGRVLSKASLEKIKAALSALQALVESVDTEPEKSTPESDKQAAELEGILNGIEAELTHFNAKQSEARINEFLERLEKEVKENA